MPTASPFIFGGIAGTSASVARRYSIISSSRDRGVAGRVLARGNGHGIGDHQRVVAQVLRHSRELAQQVGQARLLDPGAPWLELSSLAGWLVDQPDPEKCVPGGGVTAPGGTANWSFAGDANHVATNGAVSIVISQAGVVVVVWPSSTV